MRTILTFASCLAGLALCAQTVKTPFLSFADTTGSQNFFYKSVTKTDGSGNIYVAGATVNGAGNRDLLLAKYNAAGSLQWIEQYDGAAHAEDFATALYIDGSGNVFVTGAVTNNTTTSLPDLATIKYNSSGVQQWLSTFDGSGNSYDAGADITLDGSGNIYVTGGAYNATPNSDVVTLKYNSSGTQQWATQFDAPTHHDDAGLKLSVSGSTVTVSVGSQSTTAAYRFGVFKYAAATGSITGSTLTSTVTTAVNLITDMATDASGNIYLSGAVPTISNGYDMYLIKFNSNLAVQWQQTYNGAGNLDDAANGIATDASGNLYVSGYVSTASQGKDFVTQKYNSSGTLQWTQSYNSDANGDDAAADITLDNSGNVYSTGYKASDINLADYYTVKYDGSGTKVWDIQSDFSHQPDMAMGLVIDTLGNVVVTGQTQTGLGTYKYYTVKYIEKDVITPTDYNGEVPQANFMYYENKGQLIGNNDTLVPDIKFYTINSGANFYIRKNNLSFVFSKMDTTNNHNDTLQRIDLNYKGVSTSAKSYPMNQQESYLNYFQGHIPNGVTGVFANKYVITTDLYPNIDLLYSSNQNGIKLYYIVKPGGSLSDIQLEFTGATSYSLNGTSNALSINTHIGNLTFDRPTAYQLSTSNSTVAVTGWTADWQTNGASNKYKFNTGAYTSSLALVVEVDQGNAPQSPTSLNNPVWCTDVGTTNYDHIFKIDSDNSGDLYAVGSAQDHTFPHSTTMFAGNGGSNEAFLLKYHPYGTPVYRILYGGIGPDFGYNVKVDNANGVVYMVGFAGDDGYTTSTTTNFPTQNPGGGAYYHNSVSGIGQKDYGFITKFNLNGSRQWATLFGEDTPPANTYVRAIDVDNSGNIFVGGFAIKNSSFPSVTPSTGCTVHTQNITGVSTGFLAKFNLQDNLIWSTTFGNDSTVVEDLRVDAQGDLFVTGSTSATNASNFPLHREFTSDVMNSYAGGHSDGFVTKLSNCLQLKWSTLFGGSADDYAYSIEVLNGARPSTYICGKTTSNDFPIVNNSNTNALNDATRNGQDGFIASFDDSNMQNWGTFVGGSNAESLNDMEFGNFNTLFIAGESKSTDYSRVSYSGAYNQTSLENTSGGNDYDAVVLALDGSSSFTTLWSTYLGGNSTGSLRSDDHGNGITATGNTLYVGGITWSDNSFPWNADLTTYPGAYYQPYLGDGMSFSQDGFLTQFDLNKTPLSVQEIADTINNNGFAVYPNPSTGIIYIMLKDDLNNEKVNLQVFDIQGREIISTPFNSIAGAPVMFNLSHLGSGMYFVKLVGTHTNKSQKIIIGN